MSEEFRVYIDAGILKVSDLETIHDSCKKLACMTYHLGMTLSSPFLPDDSVTVKKDMDGFKYYVTFRDRIHMTEKSYTQDIIDATMK